MNKQIVFSRSKQAVFALLAFSTIGLFTTPVKADDALIQESVQESVVTGSDNVSIQNSNQSNRQHNEYRGGYGYYNRDRAGSTGIVQRSDQYCDQVGEYNTCVQDAQQSNSSYNRRDRRSRRY